MVVERVGGRMEEPPRRRRTPTPFSIHYHIINLEYLYLHGINGETGDILNILYGYVKKVFEI